MSLEAVIKKQADGGVPRGNPVGLVLKVSGYEGTGVAGDPLKISGAALMANELLDEGQEVIVEVDPRRFNEQSAKNLFKNASKKAGSVLVMEGLRKNGETYSVNYLNIIASVKERMDEDSGHNRRAVEQLVSSVPRLFLQNINKAEGEPEKINWLINQETISHEGKTFDRAWLAEKVADTAKYNQGKKWSEKINPMVSFNVYDIDSAELVDTADAVYEKLESLHKEQKGMLIRAFDDNGNVFTRERWFSRRVDAESSVEFLKENGVIHEVSDEDLFRLAQEGSAKVEIIPVQGRLFRGATLQSVVAGFAGAKQKQMMSAYGTGDNAHSFANVLMGVEVGEDHALPLPITGHIADGPQYSDIKEIPSQFYTPKAPAPKPEVPAAEDTGATPDDVPDVDAALAGDDDEPAFNAPSMSQP